MDNPSDVERDEFINNKLKSVIDNLNIAVNDLREIKRIQAIPIGTVYKLLTVSDWCKNELKK